MKKLTACLILVSVGLMVPRLSRADTENAKLDAAMQPVLGEYLKIQKALASDSQSGVAAAAQSIEKLASRLDRQSVKGKNAEHYRALPGKIKAAAGRLQRARTLADCRATFKELSQPMALWASLSRPTEVNVLYCSMAKASWLQKDKVIRNPYYGSQMLSCGEVVSGPQKGSAGGHMEKPGHGH
jgi:hypothetical protein